MAEIEPASDGLVAATEAEAKEVDEFRGDLAGVKIAAGHLRAIIARLRAEQARAEQAESARAHWHERFQVAVKTVVGQSGLSLHDRLDKLRDAERERDQLRTDNANMAKLLSGYHQICREAGIAPASSEIYAAAERATNGENNG